MPTAAAEWRRSVSTIPWIVYWFRVRSSDDQLFSVSTSSHQPFGLATPWEVAYAIDRAASLQPTAQAAFWSTEPLMGAERVAQSAVVCWPSTWGYSGW